MTHDDIQTLTRLVAEWKKSIADQYSKPGDTELCHIRDRACERLAQFTRENIDEIVEALEVFNKATSVINENFGLTFNDLITEAFNKARQE